MKRVHAWRQFLATLALGGWAVGCGAQVETWEALELGTLGQPVVATTDDYPSQQLKDDVAAVLQEHQMLPTAHPELMPTRLEPNLKVVQEADVWVTFFSEGAGHKNALGYFTYPEGQPPTSVSLTTRKANLIFTNASASGSGGSLVQGNRMHLGRFPAGARVGFFLVANGCPSGSCTADTVDYTQPTYYTLDALNPEVAASKKRHVVLVHHQSDKRHVLAFEDLNREGTNPVSDDDFNDVVFVISYNPVTAVEPSGPGIDPDSSCQTIKTRYPNATDGLYRLDPCGNGVVGDYYCDMTTPGADGRVGGWTLGGQQLASAKTSLGVTSRSTVGGADWSSNLACIPFQEAQVFNKTRNERFTQLLPGMQNGLKQVPFALGEAGRSFVQGSYGPSDSLVMMGCVRYAYDGTIFSEWACVTDWQSGGTARGHIADYAVQNNCNPAPAGARWAWANDASCRYAGELYTWGIAVR